MAQANPRGAGRIMARTITVQEPQDIAIVSNVCAAMLDKDGKLSVTVKKYDETLSDKQRRIYFKWAGIIGGELGYTKDEQHLILKERFLLNIFMQDTDNHKHDTLREGYCNLLIVKDARPDLYEGLYRSILASVSIKNASIANMREYLTEIDNLARGLGIVLPKADDAYYEAMGIKSGMKCGK